MICVHFHPAQFHGEVVEVFHRLGTERKLAKVLIIVLFSLACMAAVN